MTTTEQYETDEQAEVPAQRRERLKRPDIHLHPIHGVMLATELRTHHENLVDEENASSGTNRRLLANRRHLVGLLLAQLEDFHSITDGGE